MPSRYILPVLLCLCLAAIAQAGPLPPGQVPDALKPWIDWALWDYPDRNCPPMPGVDGERPCVWPARLALDLDEHGGRFELRVQVYAPGWVALPGAAEHWPGAVEADGQPAALEAQDDRPGLRLAPGTHTVTGRYTWDALPESLPLPAHTGLVQLSLKGKPVPIPAFNDDGALWIHDEGAAKPTEIADTLALKVYRRIDDGVPVQITTHLDLDIAGRPRELLLQGAVLDHAIPLRVDSPLPARLEPDGRLRVQARPGHWSLDIITRQPGEVAELKPGTPAEPWPAEEIWAYAADPGIRLAEIAGVPALDPRQTELPEAWKHLPAYHLEPGAAMVFKTLRRGDPDPEPDSLDLHRRLWLDFDGHGYTVNDQIGGRMTQGWRLNAGQGLDLGRVSLDGEPQSITRDTTGGGIGVEVRRGELALSADGRLPGSSALPVSGWDRDFRQVDAELNLPPGWRLLAATGVDQAPGSWIARWTLLDLFIVLIAALAVAQLWGWPWAGLAVAGLALSWHEPDAPRYIWLHVLAAVALARNLPEGRARWVAGGYRNLAALALALIALPFMAERIRVGLYPQLEYPWLAQAAPAAQAELAAPAQQPVEEAAPTAGATLDRTFRAMSKAERLSAPATPAAAPPAHPSRAIDPDAITQTGPGLPEWRWTTIPLTWNGPVTRAQEMRLFLLPPAANLVLNLLEVSLTLGLAGLLVWGKPGPGPRPSGPGGAVPPRPSLPFLLIPLLLFLPEAKAEIPSPELLETLRDRLLAPPDCQPRCAEIPLLRLETTPGELRQILDITSAAQTAVPLPAQPGQWSPSRAEVDGKAAHSLFRDEQGTLWLGLEPGRHRLVLAGPLPPREQIALPLPLKPRRVEAAGTGWTVAGIGDNGVPEQQLQLIRAIGSQGAEATPTLEARPLPPFLEVRRVLRLGLAWRVETWVQRRSPADSPVAVEIPLLPGESVVTGGLRVKDGKLLANLLPGQTQLSWESVLEPKPTLTLTAPNTTAWTESWQADVSPIWHMGSEGLAVVHHQNPAGAWLPEWRPWPGESVTLRLSRPVGIPGRTLTLDASELRLAPGQRATEATLTLRLRSSQGGRHDLELPEAAVLQSVSIDGTPQPIRPQGRTVSLPLHPGTQTATLVWRDDHGIATHLAAPELDLGAPSVNASTQIDLGPDRWVLLLGGPMLGPAVLFWGALLLILLLAYGLGRMPLSPLRFWQWALLLVGLSQISALGGILVVAWLLALAWRERSGRTLGDRGFKALQIGLALLTLAALASLLEAVQQGLLGLPEMQVAGNGSDAYHLHWYQDRAESRPPRPWVVSAPLWLYRGLMLAWALWLAYALLDWLRWGWTAYAADGWWRTRPQADPPEP
ncbi:hypothetical protein [Methylomagnum ishizawai]|uniref:hypothetical protein n=1 Tax=Methylomagnum ishizawai TaxID=1760988 RepID=UPI001C32516A|nr:hypothetical protein [Methylomagnum ishizawai]BBL74370.1 hypothetical protein MishRS11D_14680 [Methylomagnum ishizawai]